MDGENNGKPYFLMDDLGGVFPLFLETPNLLGFFADSPCGTFQSLLPTTQPLLSEVWGGDRQPQAEMWRRR